MVPVKTFTFLKDASAALTGIETNNLYKGDLTLAVTGVFTATVKIQGKLGEDWHDLRFVKVDDLSVVDDITEAGVYAVICAEGFEELRAVVSSYTSGSITAVGRFTYGG